MNINTLTIKAQEVLQSAISLARERGQQAVEPMHLLNAMISEDDSLAAFLLGRVGVNVKMLRDEARSAVDSLPRVSGGNGGLTNTRLAYEDRVVLCSARENLQHSANLLIAANYGIELATASLLVEIYGVFTERIELLR